MCSLSPGMKQWKLKHSLAFQFIYFYRLSSHVCLNRCNRQSITEQNASMLHEERDVLEDITSLSDGQKHGQATWHRHRRPSTCLREKCHKSLRTCIYSTSFISTGTKIIQSPTNLSPKARLLLYVVIAAVQQDFNPVQICLIYYLSSKRKAQMAFHILSKTDVPR